MKNSDYISIAELSATVNRSRQWIYKMIDTKPSFKAYVRIIDGKKMIHKSVIWKEFGIGVEHIQDDAAEELPPVTPEEKTISLLEAQLKEKDEQIKRKDEQINNLLSAQMALHNRIMALEDKLISTPEPETAKEPDQEEPSPDLEGLTTKQPEAQPETAAPGRLSIKDRFVKWLRGQS